MTAPAFAAPDQPVPPLGQTAPLGQTDPSAVPPRRPKLAFDGQTWREVLFLLLNLPFGIVGFIYVVVMVSLGAGLAVTVVGLPLLSVGLVVCRAFGHVERARARALLGLDVPTPSRMRRGSGPVGWVRATLGDSVAWRHALYLFIRLPWSIFTFTFAVVLLAVAWPVLPFFVTGLAAADRAMVRALLSPSDSMERRIRELEAGRGTVVDAAAADLRRIERDLHDGAQARLVALAMDLGLARAKLAEDPDTAARMVDEAHGEVKLVLQELRDLARGIHPAILTDRGLTAALTSLGARCTVPATVDVDLAERPAMAIEGIVYFTTAELLTNISKHSGAANAKVDVWRVEADLFVRVVDDGRGGADPSDGSGLAGLAERLGAVDGGLTVDSPLGGPTTVVARLPWREHAPA